MSIDVTVVGSSGQQLEELIRTTAGMRVTTAPSVERLASTGSYSPDVILVDSRQQAMLPAGLAQLKKERPGLGIVIVAARPEPSLMLEAMRAGIGEYLTEPLSRADLAAAIKRVAGPERARAGGEVFAMIGVKGGVGVTTLAVNVATTLAKSAPGSVLLIDLYPACGDAALYLGAEPQFTVLDALENASRLDESYLKGLVTKTRAGTDLLASPDRLVAVDSDANRVRSVVETASRCYRYVVLDVPRWGAGLAGALDLSSNITVVTTQDVASLRNGNRLTTFLRQRYGTERLRITVNRFDRSAQIGETDIERALGGPLCGTFPSAERVAVDALNKGLPAVVENHTKLSGAFDSYARSLVAASGPEESVEKPRLFGILGGRRR